MGKQSEILWGGRSMAWNGAASLPKPFMASMKAIAAVIVATVGGGTAHAATSCETVRHADLPGGTITSVTLVPAGSMEPIMFNGRKPSQANIDTYHRLPAFCRIKAELHPAPDSTIGVELWAPAEGWNGRLQMIGNGAYFAVLQYGELAKGVAKHYAVVATDTGHTTAQDNDFWINHPEKVVDWETRSVHETAIAGKAIVAALYGSGPKYSYWNSCSTGGRQGWMEAEYHPEDFDGLAIGDPANPMTRLQGSSIWLNLMLNRSTTSFIPVEKWAMIQQTFKQDCDAKDGLKDGLVENPLACHFDTRKLLCKGEDNAACLTAPQLESLEAVERGLRDPHTGEQLYPGYPLSSWLPGPISGKDPDTSAPLTYRILYNDPKWDYHSFDPSVDIPRADKLGKGTMNAVEPERLKALFARGGKVLMYHGWEDQSITPLIGIKLYEDAVKANGGVEKTKDLIRLFMVPGHSHCDNPFDQMDVITKWVEQGVTPTNVIVSYAPAAGENAHGARTRKVCAWPQVARYKGKGSVDEESSFTCVKASI